jgi:hypothetical protein
VTNMHMQCIGQQRTWWLTAFFSFWYGRIDVYPCEKYAKCKHVL